MVRKLLSAGAVAALLASYPANAAVTTITFLDATSGSHNGAFSLDAGSNAYALGVICGGTAAAIGTTVATCAEVNASGQIAIAGPVTNAGTFPVQVSSAGAATVVGTAWPTTTASGTTQSIAASGATAQAFLVQLDQGAGISAGAITFQTSGDSTAGSPNWATITSSQVVDPTSTSGAFVTLPFALTASTQKQFYICTMGSALRMEVSTTITGGTVTPYITPIPLAQNICGAQQVQGTSINSLNPVQVLTESNGSTGQPVPNLIDLMGANSSGISTAVIQADNSAPINVSTATTTQLIALVSAKKIYVTSWDVISNGTGNITLEYGTGSNCGTGTTVLTGAYPLTAQAGYTKGSGLGPILIVPASNALCALTSAGVQISGSLSYTQF